MKKVFISVNYGGCIVAVAENEQSANEQIVKCLRARGISNPTVNVERISRANEGVTMLKEPETQV